MLITSFKAFGIHKRITGRNVSYELMSLIKQHHGNQFEYLAIEASDDGIKLLVDRIQERMPTGIIMLGEALFTLRRSINVELYANDLDVNANQKEKKIYSDFASHYIESKGIRSKSMISNYYCNQAYRQGLKLLKEYHQPVAFVHVPVFGEREKQYHQVMNIIDFMSKWRPGN